jgi:hypothetical protein
LGNACIRENTIALSDRVALTIDTAVLVLVTAILTNIAVPTVVTALTTAVSDRLVLVTTLAVLIEVAKPGPTRVAMIDAAETML